MACEEAFIECTSLSFSYDIMGIVTVSYTMIHTTSKFCYRHILNFGGKVFKGYIADMSLNRIPGTAYYSTNVTMIATAV